MDITFTRNGRNMVSKCRYGLWLLPNIRKNIFILLPKSNSPLKCYAYKWRWTAGWTLHKWLKFREDLNPWNRNIVPREYIEIIGDTAKATSSGDIRIRRCGIFSPWYLWCTAGLHCCYARPMCQNHFQNRVQVMFMSVASSPNTMDNYLRFLWHKQHWFQ